MPFRNRSVIPQGMLAPNGYVDTRVDPFVQATTRPPGTLLAPSPGYDSIRQGKNEFQGKGPTGGFRPLTFAEDVGGTGAALSVIPGDTTDLEASEWVSGGPGMTPEGTFIIADRSLDPGYAQRLHEGNGTLADMGDRHPARPISNDISRWVWHPAKMLRSEWADDPVVAVLASIALVGVLYMTADHIEQSIRGRGVAGTATEPAKESNKVTDTGISAIDKTLNKAIDSIESVTNDAIAAVTKATKTVTE